VPNGKLVSVFLKNFQKITNVMHPGESCLTSFVSRSGKYTFTPQSYGLLSTVLVHGILSNPPTFQPTGVVTLSTEHGLPSGFRLSWILPSRREFSYAPVELHDNEQPPKTISSTHSPGLKYLRRILYELHTRQRSRDMI
jgi:hypothetical protein